MNKNKIAHPLEWDHWPSYDLILGLDEAGRGPIAGPLVVAGVIFPKDYANEDLYDSKKLSEKKRNQLFEQIKADALAYEIRIVSEVEVDRLNIYRATQHNMECICNNLNQANFVFSDAMPLPNIKQPFEAFVKGDQKSLSIAAASILAKVTRDALLVELDVLYPEYGFAKHKGYPTKAHLEALDLYGVLDCHRKTYGPVAKNDRSPTKEKRIIM
ncbi:MAG: ribonuclease HII [Erysipelotrichaceae bacterium]